MEYYSMYSMTAAVFQKTEVYFKGVIALIFEKEVWKSVFIDVVRWKGSLKLPRYSTDLTSFFSCRCYMLLSFFM